MRRNDVGYAGLQNILLSLFSLSAAPLCCFSSQNTLIQGNISGVFWNCLLGNLFPLLIMALAPGNFCVQFKWRKVTSARRVTRCCTTCNPPLEVAPGQRKTHVNSYRRPTVHRGKADPGVSELPQGNELSRDHMNRP